MKRAVTLEIAATLLAVVLAAGIRLAALGDLPLSDGEARLALQSLDIVRGQTGQVTTQPLYVLLTATGFALLNANNSMARFWPAVAGILLAGAPFLYRKMLGRGAAVLLAFWVALDPGLVAISREAGSPVVAVAALALAGGLLFNRRVLAAGIFVGLGLLSGPGLWPGVISLVLVGWATGVYREMRSSIGGDEPSVWHLSTARVVLLALAAAFILGGSLFMLVPSGLSAAANDLPAYLAGWTSPGPIWPFLPVWAMMFYEILAVLLGMWGMITGLIRKNRLDRFLTVWALVALALVLFYPAREVRALVWPLIPLLVLAARQAARLISENLNDPVPTLAQAVLAVVLLAFAWMNLVAWFNTTAAGDPWLRAAAILGAMILLALTALLMGMGWSWPAARQGLALGAGLFLVFYTVGMTYRAAGLAERPEIELWRADPVVVDADLLAQTISDLSKQNTGEAEVIEVVIAGVDSPALRWALRGQRAVSQILALPQGAQPPLVITPLQESLELASSYRGQDFIWTQTPPWSILFEREWARWLVGRAVPLESDLVVLWARTDLFAGETAQPAPAVP